jgi:PTS system nitrogen regulatory IIA component
MQLTIRDVAQTFQVSENVVSRWIAEKNLPATQVDGSWRFNRVQVLEWAALNKLAPGPAAYRPNGVVLPRLDDSLRVGGPVLSLRGTDKAAVLREMIASVPLPDGTDREELLQLFSGREALGSTAIGDGIALPHPRRPIVIPGRPPGITVCYLSSPLEFNAPDKQPVHTLFALLSPTVRAHVHLLARLMTALRDPGFRAAVQRKAQADELIGEAERLEESFARP